MKEFYKFERFRDQSFPVYSSRQSGSGVLVIPHFHKAAELLRVTDGTISLFVHGHRYLCGAGDIVFIPPYSIHSVICEDGTADIRGIVFELSLLREDVFGLSAEQILHKNVIEDYIFTAQRDSYADLDGYLWQALDAYDRNTVTYKLEILAALYGIAAILVNHYFQSSGSYESYGRLQPVMDYISQNYQHDLTLAELSAILNICDDHLIRLFKSAIGKTPGRYITQLRLQEAMKLLMDTELSITACACKAGFSSVNYMSRIFRTNLNLTPSQFRKKNRKKSAR